MMKSQNVFNTIRRQIISNESMKLRLENEKQNTGSVTDVFRVRGYYPEKVICWLTQKAKAFKIDKITKEYDNGINVYKINYKNLNVASPFLAQAYEIAENNITKYYRAHEFDNMSVVDKAMAKNDKYRTELECPNFDYERYGLENEFLEKADSTTFELFLQKIGFNNYDEFAKYMDMTDLSVSEIIDEMYEEFKEKELVPSEFPDGNVTEGILY